MIDLVELSNYGMGMNESFMLDQVKQDIYQLIEQLPAGKLFQAKELLEGLLVESASSPSTSTTQSSSSESSTQEDSIVTFVKEAIIDLNDGDIGFREIDEDLGELSKSEWPKYLFLLMSSEALKVSAKKVLLKGFINKTIKSQNSDTLKRCWAIFEDLRVEAWQIAFEELAVIFQRQFDKQCDVVEMRDTLLERAQEALNIESPPLVLTVASVLNDLSSPENKLVFVMSRPFKDTKLRKQVTDALCKHLQAFSLHEWQEGFQILAQYPSSEITQALYNSLKLDQFFPVQIQKNLLAYFRAHGTDNMFVEVARQIVEPETLSEEIAHFLLILIKSSTISAPDLINTLKKITAKIANNKDAEIQELALEILATKFK